MHWLDAGSDDLLDQLRVLNGFDVDLAADQTRVANRLRDTLTGMSPALERALGARLAHAGVRDLLAKHPAPSALRQAGRARILRVVKARPPCLAAKVTEEVIKALDAQSVTVPAETTLGRVVAELAGELDRTYAGRDRLAAEIEEVFTAHPFGRLLQTLPGSVRARGRGSWPRSVTAPGSRPATASPPTPGSPPPNASPASSSTPTPTRDGATTG